MKILFLITFFIFGLVGCSKSTVCDAGKVASGLVAVQVAANLDCKQIDLVKADIEKKLVDLKICEAPTPTTTVMAVNAIGDAICKPVIDGLVAGLLTQVPQAWECSGGKITDEIKIKLMLACGKAFQ